MPVRWRALSFASRTMSASSPKPAVNHGLNLAQQEAVNYLHGPCLVGGAGSGKTRVITHKIARLIQSGWSPAHCCHHLHQQGRCRDARTRRGFDRQGRQDVVVCTFHALGVRMLRMDGQEPGLKPNSAS